MQSSTTASSINQPINPFGPRFQRVRQILQEAIDLLEEDEHEHEADDREAGSQESQSSQSRSQ